MKVILVPILKCNTANTISSTNYRPIAITTVASKLLELIIQHRIDCLMETNCSHFGFKAGHSFYISDGSPIFTCFIDTSKAFDRVNHLKLFEKLMCRSLRVYITENLSY